MVLRESVCLGFSMMSQRTVLVFVNLADMFHHSYHSELIQNCFNFAEVTRQTRGPSHHSKGAEGNTKVFMTNRTEHHYGEDGSH